MDVHRALVVQASASGAIDARQVTSDQVLQEHCFVRSYARPQDAYSVNPTAIMLIKYFNTANFRNTR